MLLPTLVGWMWASRVYADDNPLGLLIGLGLGFGTIAGCIVVHEFVHAAAGRLLGATVLEVRVGGSRTFRSFRVGRMMVTLGRPFFGGGVTRAVFDETPPTRGRVALFLAAPSVVHLLLVAVALPSSRFLSADPGFNPADVVWLANAGMLVLNLLPGRLTVDGLSTGNDGRQILRILTEPVSLSAWRRATALLNVKHAVLARDEARITRDLARARETLDTKGEEGAALGLCHLIGDRLEAAVRFARESFESRAPDKSELTEEEFERALLGFPPAREAPRLVLALALARTGEVQEALHLVRARAATAPEALAAFLKVEAAEIYARRSPSESNLHDACALMDEALAALPWVGHFYGAHALLLTAVGNHIKALAALETADAFAAAPEFIAFHQAYRAVACAGLHRVEEGRRHLANAARFCWDTDLLSEAKERLSAAEAEVSQTPPAREVPPTDFA